MAVSRPRTAVSRRLTAGHRPAVHRPVATHPLGYGAPPPKRGGPSLLVIGAIGLALVLLLGVGGMYAFGLGPFAPAATPTSAAQVTPTPKPTKTPASATATPTEGAASPTASAAPETTAPATTAPATTAPATAPATSPGISFPPFTIPPIGTPGPTPSMTEADTALLAHVPQDFRDSCTPTVAVTPAIASLNCNTGFERGIFMSYTSYPDTTSMNTDYQLYVTAFGTGAGNGTCETSSDWPAEGSYTIDNVEAGRLLCVDSGGVPTMWWTDERLNILSSSFGVGDVTADDMWSFWANEAGPF